MIHNTRAGLVKAIRGLQQGAVVIIMPDVYQDESETYQLPFCGRPLSVMLGTAALARKTGAGVLPMIARAESTGIRFSNLAGPLLRPGGIDAGAERDGNAGLHRTRPDDACGDRALGGHGHRHGHRPAKAPPRGASGR